MFNRNTIGAAILALAALVPATSFAAAKAPCFLDSYRVTSVEPYRPQQELGHSKVSHLRGAQIFVQAQPGLTAEWLRLQVAQHVQQMQSSSTRMPDCPLDVSGTQVQVDPAGTGFSVKLIAQDSHRAQEILDRARLLVD
jgi:hypothetical protein